MDNEKHAVIRRRLQIARKVIKSIKAEQVDVTENHQRQYISYLVTALKTRQMLTQQKVKRTA